MIMEMTGDLFTSDAEAIVNPCNLLGIFGKGLSKEFYTRYPADISKYAMACRSGKFNIGEILVTKCSDKYIIHFPTKIDWRQDSKLEYIEASLNALAVYLNGHNIMSVAMPKVGCGCGNLYWDEVKPLVVAKLEPLPNVLVCLYE
jgi:O-acetyl-ADP-ribose deacetylase (regulator of RNase III)